MTHEQRAILPRNPRCGTTWEVTIDELSVDGRGVAYLPAAVGPQREHKMLRFLVRKAVPGDRVAVLVERRSGEYLDAHIEEMLDASPMRIEPRCRHFGRREQPGKGCGGCTLQALSYRHQLAAKEKTVKSLFRNAGLDPGAITPMIGQDEPWFYRNNMEFSFGDTANREFALGMYPSGYHYEILNLEECFLESEFTSEFLPKAREWAKEHDLEPYINSQNEGFLRTVTIREGERTGERLIDLMTTHAPETTMDGEMVPARRVAEAFAEFAERTADELDAPLTSMYWTQKKAIRGQPTEWIDHHLEGKPVLEEELHLPDGVELRFEIDPRAFFQTNTVQAEVLYRQVLEKSGLMRADEPVETVLDLYCGTGTIGLAMAPYAERVLGVELQADAVENARANADLNGIDNAEFVEGDVREILDDEELRAELTDVDLVVVDPPRTGLLEEARDHVVEIGAPRVVYVSCNPEKLARDLADLTERGYRVEAVQPVDMFPQTYHIECVVELTRRAPTTHGRDSAD